MLLNHLLNIENVDFEGISMVPSEVLDDCVGYEVENHLYLALFFHPMSKFSYNKSMRMSHIYK